MKTDIAFTNGGGIYINDNIPPDPITAYDMEGLFYYDNGLVSFELSGAQLLEVLKNSVSKSHLGYGRFLQISGLRFKYHGKESNGVYPYTIYPAEVAIKPQGSSVTSRWTFIQNIGSPPLISYGKKVLAMATKSFPEVPENPVLLV